MTVGKSLCLARRVAHGKQPRRRAERRLISGTKGSTLPSHGRAWPGHPRLWYPQQGSRGPPPFAGITRGRAGGSSLSLPSG